jgi:nucleoid DNA-binding protein
MGLNKATLVNAVAEKSGLSKADSERAIKATLDVIFKY